MSSIFYRTLSMAVEQFHYNHEGMTELAIKATLKSYYELLMEGYNKSHILDYIEYKQIKEELDTIQSDINVGMFV